MNMNRTQKDFRITAKDLAADYSSIGANPITAKDLAVDYSGLINFFRKIGDSRFAREALAVDYSNLFRGFGNVRHA